MPDVFTVFLNKDDDDDDDDDVAPHQLSCQISANQRKAETSTNVNKHWKTNAKGNDIITNIISTNQHSTLTFWMHPFKFQRRSCKLSFLFPPLHQTPPPPTPLPKSLLACWLQTWCTVTDNYM